MIRVDKPEVPPDRLTVKGKERHSVMKAGYTRYRADYDAGERTFEFDSSIYGHTSVKNALKTAQHEKCCFCESKVSHVAYGDVEHFRPKGGYRQNKGDPLGRPGYYWLAYDWSNLFLSCQICNQRFKKNLFPLLAPANRALSHHDDIASEEPVFIHPELEAPEDHITFRDEIAVARTDRGDKTIGALGLDRPAMEDMRREILKPFEVLRDLLASDPTGPESAEIKALFHSAKQPNHQYSAMFRAFLND